MQAGFGWEAKTTTRHLKVAFYLDDELDAETGALRVIPGSHLNEGLGDSLAAMDLERPRRAHPRPLDVPATVVDTRKGDVVIFDHRTKRECGNSRLGLWSQNCCRL